MSPVCLHGPSIYSSTADLSLWRVHLKCELSMHGFD
jgi:hypothetical protein